MIKKRIWQVAFAVVVSAGLASCTAAYTEVRYEAIPSPVSGWSDSKGGITITTRHRLVDSTPKVFLGREYKCVIYWEGYRYNELRVGLDVEDMVDISLVPPGSVIYEMVFENKTDHVVRLPGAIVSLTDPNSKVYRTLTVKKLLGHLYLDQHRPCPISPQLTLKLDDLPLADQSLELLPGHATTAYAVFLPQNALEHGVWKLTVYDMPVVIGKAGEPTEVVAMKTETILQKWVDVFVPGDWGEDDKKTSVNITDGGTEEEVLKKVLAKKKAAEEK